MISMQRGHSSVMEHRWGWGWVGGGGVGGVGLGVEVSCSFPGKKHYEGETVRGHSTFKCYVTQLGVEGGSAFPEKKRYESAVQRY